MLKRVRELPSLDLLKGFEAAARNLSFTKAAAELFVTQSAISRQVQTLENQLGVALFRRHHRDLRLTEEGERRLAKSFTSDERERQALLAAFTHLEGRTLQP